jgi:photosystem II stability/assembly factor-like uncharacterized protein
MMRNFVLLLVFSISSASTFSQFVQLRLPSPAEVDAAPDWARLMYSDTTRVADVDQAYQRWLMLHAGEKNYHTQYYKRWRRIASLCMNAEGYVDITKRDGFYAGTQTVSYDSGMRSGSGNWTPMGPLQTYRSDGAKENDQTNVYSITQCTVDPNVLYCGTEPGEIYKSTDGGNTWQPSSLGYFFNGVEAIAVDPQNPDVVYAANGYNLMKSDDGGDTWNSVLYEVSLWPHEILVHPTENNIVLVAAESGVFRSEDSGATWTEVSGQTGWDLRLKPGSDSVVYSLQRNASEKRSEFYVSTDKGLSWELKDNGWYTSSDPARYDGGSRLAVTPADPERVYAYLIGDSKSGDHGYIGLYRSDDGGENWYLPNGPVGGPYTTDHANLAIGWVGWDYHQGYYNCALAASPDDPDKILVGGLNLYKSDDGGFTFSAAGGYVGGYLPIHVDMQDFRVTESGTWITNDGGITYSDNFYETDLEIRMQGLHGSDYWGFGMGWNDDVHVGGLYHNGNLAWYENYGEGNYLQMGGAEPPSGYVNPGNNFKVYSSELGAVTIPVEIGLPLSYGGLGIAPNESYWSASSSEMEFHPACYGIAYVGRDNKLWKSEDGGASFNALYTFPGAAAAQVRYFEICRSNPQVIYVSQAPSGGGGMGRLWKSTDGGGFFSELAVPGTGGGRDRILLAVDPEDEFSVYLAYPGGGSTTKVYHSTDGGLTWNNISGSVFSGHEIRSLLFAGAANGSLYASTNYGVFFRDHSMDDWIPFNEGLPYYANTNILKPFYRDGKIRMASYGKGVWESPLEIAPLYPIAQPIVDKLHAICTNEAFYFEDYSILLHAGASWNWEFEGGVPATSTERNPIVYFDSPGLHTATLTVTDALGNSSTASLEVEIATVTTTFVDEDFEGSFPPFEWTTQGLNAGGSIWNKTTNAGSYGLSTSSAGADNYYNDLGGNYGDLRSFINLQDQEQPMLFFDVAYAEYGYPYTDTLEVLVSSDCGETFTLLYRKGGSELATAEPYTADTYIPTADEWRTDSVDLSDFADMENVMVVFRNWGHWGQMMYLDNVNISGLALGFPQLAKNQDAILSPNPVSMNGSLIVTSKLEDDFIVTFYTMEGKIISRVEARSGEAINWNAPAVGSYLYLIESNEYMRTGVLVVQ